MSEVDPGAGPAVTGGEAEEKKTGSQGKTFESREEIDLRAAQAGEGQRFWRKALWILTFVLLIGASGWALLSVVCGFMVASFSGWSEFEKVWQGFVPLAGILVLAALLWLVVGPPFDRRAGK